MTRKAAAVSHEPGFLTGRGGFLTGRGFRNMGGRHAVWGLLAELALLVGLFFLYGGDPPPMVNEAHYLAQAKHFWDPSWCPDDQFLTSAKAHAAFYALFGWPTRLVSLETAAWVGRLAGWLTLAIGLRHLTRAFIPVRFASLAVATVWIAGIEYANFAGEWVVGGIEGKVPAYGLTLVGMGEMARRRWQNAWVALGAAAAFHVLVGGWSVIATLVAWGMTEARRPNRAPLFRPGLLVGGGLALVGLVPAVWLTAGVTAEESAAAARIYTYFRLPHHLLPSSFPTSWYVRHGVLVVATGGLLWAAARHGRRPAWRRVGWFAFATVGLAIIGLGIGTLTTSHPDLAARLLRYYWFRLTDVAVPLVAALAVARLFVVPLVLRSPPTPYRGTGSFRFLVSAALLLVSAAAVGRSSFERMRLGVPPAASHRILGWDADAPPKRQQATFRDWLAVCRFIHATTPEDETFLTPRHQQTFKWYAGRAEVVNWKDVPQDAASLQDWTTRFREVFPRRLGTVRVSIQYSTLRELAEKYDVRYLLVDRRVNGPHLPLVRIYPRAPERNDTYAIYELPR